jgi:hypothetical protein
MKRVLIAVVLAWLGCVAVRGSTWQVSYEGNELPEQQPPWYRMYSPPGDTRTIQADPNNPGNHWLVIDSRADHLVYDWAEYVRPMDPQGPQERFWSEWRISVLEQTGLDGDQGIELKDEHGRDAQYSFGYSQIRCDDDGWTHPIAPAVFHTYRIESANMITYRLWIDGVAVRDAPFFEGLGGPFAIFGDFGSGGNMRSLCEWDYVRFGVMQVPEPSSAFLFLLMGMCAHGCRGYARRGGRKASRSQGGFK